MEMRMKFRQTTRIVLLLVMIVSVLFFETINSYANNLINLCRGADLPCFFMSSLHKFGTPSEKRRALLLLSSVYG